MKQVHIRRFAGDGSIFKGNAGCVYIYGVPIEWVDYEQRVLTITVGQDCEVEVTKRDNGDLEVKLAGDAPTAETHNI